MSNHDQPSMNPANEAGTRAGACQYVAELLVRGCIAAKADAEIHMGKGGPTEPRCQGVLA